ncbi:hypothetical protein D0469_12450 [Peribacillus saganii]|uniref:Uncharacterized protein n=1 Tax=Peribacillus saganii TaxID=2303992 RepID=A0A372LM92_9BACI|nr:hypothetical protein [Peribacillus saganii]RFU68317.1 hypothetical protein D0469_12450 [Peribacillus saganii]
MSHKSFVITVMSIVLACVLSSASFIYFIDPMWTFGHANAYNDVQTVVDERQQKTNTIHFQPFEYDTLLIGSSRSTYINQHDFSGMNVYNFSASNLSVREYNPFIEYAKKRRGKEFDRVILGIDFFKTSRDQSTTTLSLDRYITKSNERFYRYKNLLSWDLLEYSYQNYKMSRDNTVLEERNYNRENAASARKISPEKVKQQTEGKIEKFREMFYGKTYAYNPQYKNILMQLKKNNPNTEFIIFTTPISTPLFKELVAQNRLPAYERWLTDVTDVFGGVHNFMYPNTVTNDINNYFDGHHFYPETGTLIAHRLSGETGDVPKDFGMYVTKEQLPAHLQMIRKKAAELVKSNEGK